jgi:lipid II:glycine glycyltransferase (peptidoglycan interpeptide bridge formation enzyme)
MNTCLPDTHTQSPTYHVVYTESNTESLDPDWDAFLARPPGGHHVQTSRWALLKRMLGWRAVRVVVWEERERETVGGEGPDKEPNKELDKDRKEIVGGAQILLRTFPLLGSVGYVYKAPLTSRHDPALTTILLNAIEEVAKVYRIQYTVIQPPHCGFDDVAGLHQRGYLPSHMSMGPEATILIDLTADPETLLAQMHAKTRKAIRRGQRKGITIREGTIADIPTFYHLLLATAHRQQFTPYEADYFVEMWQLFAPIGAIVLLLAEYEGEPVSTELDIGFGDTVVAKKCGWSGEYGSYQPNELVQWEAFLWAQRHGYHFYDLEGIDEAAAHHLIQGNPLPPEAHQTVTSFKLGFGGQVTLFPGTYERFLHPVVQWCWHEGVAPISQLPIVQRALAQLHLW